MVTDLNVYHMLLYTDQWLNQSGVELDITMIWIRPQRSLCTSNNK